MKTHTVSQERASWSSGAKTLSWILSLTHEQAESPGNIPGLPSAGASFPAPRTHLLQGPHLSFHTGHRFPSDH